MSPILSFNAEIQIPHITFSDLPHDTPSVINILVPCWCYIYFNVELSPKKSVSIGGEPRIQKLRFLAAEIPEVPDMVFLKPGGVCQRIHFHKSHPVRNTCLFNTCLPGQFSLISSVLAFTSCTLSALSLFLYARRPAQPLTEGSFRICLQPLPPPPLSLSLSQFC